MTSESIVLVNTPEKARELFFKEVDDCYWNPKLKIKVLENEDRTVVTSKPIQNKESLVILNTNSYFGHEKTEQYSKEDLSKLSEKLRIAAYLYQFYTGHTKSYPKGYNHYFNALPTYEWYAKNHLLLAMYLELEEEQKKEIKKQFFILEQMDELTKWVEQIPGHAVNIEQIRRCILICVTRTWSVGLVPWIDFFNHAYNGSGLANDATTINATHEYQAGQEVNTTYGDKDSLQLLNTYGFSSKEKTLAIPKPPVSSFAIALDPELQVYQQLSNHNPFMVYESVHNTDYLLGYLRLCTLSKIDILNIQDIHEEHKKIINPSNEHKTVKLALLCIEEITNQIQTIKKRMLKVIDPIPSSWEEDLNVKFEILKNLKKKVYVHWLKMIDDDDV